MLADSAEANRTIEAEFARWAKAAGLPEKLHTMRQARAQDGETFALLFNNAGLDNPVKLDLRLIEADQVTTPDLSFDKSNAVDGVVQTPRPPGPARLAAQNQISYQFMIAKWRR